MFISPNSNGYHNTCTWQAIWALTDAAISEPNRANLPPDAANDGNDDEWEIMGPSQQLSKCVITLKLLHNSMKNQETSMRQHE